ncbi:hypothetical protein HUJ04_005264 [Dendroctonus ponderosae]|nr:hypothetical protein HUJ04_005264 [Dendroctonus ponderosae]
MSCSRLGNNVVGDSPLLCEEVKQKCAVNGAAKPHEEHQYLNHIKLILEKGVKTADRTGVGTYSIFGAQMRYSLRDNIFPLLTTKRVFWRAVVEELLWFIRGSTNAFELKDKNVHIWDANSTREFLDSVGLKDREEGDLGPIYGFQWRHFGAEYKGMRADYKNKGIDQLAHVINTIRNKPTDRRMIMCAWNPETFLKWLCAPVIALCNLGEFIHSLGDSHVYLNHVEPLKEQIQREPRPFPTLQIKRKVETIEDFTADDFEIVGYNPHPKLSMAMAV